MHPSRLSAFAVSGATARGWDDPAISFRKTPTMFAPTRGGSPLLRALQRIVAARRRRDRPPSGSGGLPPRTQSCDGHWEDPLLWLLVIH